MSELAAYAGASFDPSQGIPEVNWALMGDAKRRGVGCQVLSRTMLQFEGNPRADEAVEDLVESPATVEEATLFEATSA